MHELALCRSMLAIINQQAEQQAFSRVSVVRLEVGDLAAVDLEALRFGFSVASRNTPAAAASLEIIPVHALAWCPQCRREVVIRRRVDACPACGRFGLQVSGGDELRIIGLVVD